MAEYPILFSTEMVRAVLDSHKTQTRRIIKPQPFRDEGKKRWVYRTRKEECLHYPNATEALRDLCPYGKVGDTLWVRENFAIFDVDGDEDIAIGYKADDTYKSVEWFLDKRKDFKKLRLGKWRPSIHMHRWTARIFLEITNIRVERVQDISLEDCKAEGVSDDPTEDWRELFMELWGSLNIKRGYGWDKNPWVWIIEFQQLPERK